MNTYLATWIPSIVHNHNKDRAQAFRLGQSFTATESLMIWDVVQRMAAALLAKDAAIAELQRQLKKERARTMKAKHKAGIELLAPHDGPHDAEVPA